MARRAVGASAGVRLTDCLSAGVLAKTFPLETVHAVLAETGRASQRERDLPAHVMAYYVIARALYSPAPYGEVLRTLLEGARWLAGPDATAHVPGRSGISQARTRLGEAPLRELFARVVHPVATPATLGAFYRRWRTVGLDGTTLDVADTYGRECAGLRAPDGLARDERLPAGAPRGARRDRHARPLRRRARALRHERGHARCGSASGAHAGDALPG